MKKKENLNKYNFSTKKGFNGVLLRLRYDHLSKYFKGTNCLELGCADGEGTKILLKYFKSITAVDGSRKLLSRAKAGINNKKVRFIISYFEELNLKEKFDTVIMAHILEHVDDPISVIAIGSKLLKKGGVLIIDVPNAFSLHRQAGVLMNMLKDEHDLNSADRSIGHKRVYDINRLIQDVEEAGLKVQKSGGIFLKPFSNGQMEKILPKKGIEAFSSLGLRYPDISAEIYVICGFRSFSTRS